MAEIDIHGSKEESITKDEYIKMRETFASQIDDDDVDLSSYVDSGDYTHSMSDILSEDDKKRGRRKKVNVLSLLTSIVINGTPIIVKMVKRRKEGLPVKVSKTDILKLTASSVLPTVMAADDIFNKGRLQDKTGDTLSHIRNIANVVSMYPDGYQVVNNMSIQNKYKNKVNNGEASTIPVGVGNTKSGLSLFTKTTNLFSPYVIDIMCNKDLPFMEKISTVMPIKVVGHLVQRFAYANPATRKVYETVANGLRAGSVVVNGVGGAVRASKNGNGTVNKGLSMFQTIIESTGDIMGVKTRQDPYNRYNNGGYNGNYNSYWNN